MIYFQTELFSLATSIDFEERNLLANQKLFLRYNSNLDWKDILFRDFDIWFKICDVKLGKYKAALLV